MDPQLPGAAMNEQLTLFGIFWELSRSSIPGRWVVQCLRCGLKNSYIGTAECSEWAWTHDCLVLR